MRLLRFASAALLSVPAGALAQEAEEPPICTDRPTKGNGVCTVPVGKWQLESAAIGWSRTEADASETKVLTLGSSVLKLGLSERSDLQVGFTPYVHAETRAGSARSTVSGLGDLTVRYKHRLTRDSAPVQVGVIPFVKWRHWQRQGRGRPGGAHRSFYRQSRHGRARPRTRSAGRR